MRNEEIIKAAVNAYPYLDIPFEFENASATKIIAAAKSDKFGDGLLSFIVTELAGCTSKDEAVHRMDVAVAELPKVLRALEDL